jgi:hypothetical protein
MIFRQGLLIKKSIDVYALHMFVDIFFIVFFKSLTIKVTVEDKKRVNESSYGALS